VLWHKSSGSSVLGGAGAQIGKVEIALGLASARAAISRGSLLEPTAMNVIPSLALRLPLAVVCLAVGSARAQERVFPPLPESIDVKTAAEASRAPDAVLPRSVAGAPIGPASARTQAAPKAHVIDRASPAPRAFAIDHSRMEYDTPGDGSLWARGAHFKASFDAAGATYFPLFTPAQPRHYPIVLSPDRVTLGGEPLALEGTGVARRELDRVTLDRASFVESYDMCAASIEQTFTFRTLPHGGDLVVHVPLSGEIAPRECFDGIELKSEFGRVTYGRATAIDARGTRFAAATEVLEDGIEIRVDAAFLATATLPLVIDPVVSTFAIDNTSYDDLLGDVSYDVTNNRWLAVYEERVTVSDNDAYWVMCNAAGAGMWGGYINSDTNSWDNVRCANLRSAQQFMAVGAVYNGSSSNIRGRQISAAIFSISGEITISGSDSGNKGQPQIGGDPYPTAPAYYCVSYDRYYSPNDNDILARLVAPNGTLVGPGTIYLSNSGGTIDDTSSVSRSNGEVQWTIAWSRWNSFGSSDIWAARISYSGVVVNQPYQLTAGNNDTFVSVSSPLSGSQRTMIVFNRDYGTDNDIQALVQDGTTPITSANLSTMSGGSWFNKGQTNAAVDCDGRHFLVTYAEQHVIGDGWDYDIYADDLYLADSTLAFAQLHVPVATLGTRDYWPRVATQWSSGGPSGRAFVEWTKTAATNVDDVQGAMFDLFEGGTWDFVCTGDGTGNGCPCGNTGAYLHGCANSASNQGGLLMVGGSISTLAGTTTLNVSYVPTTTTCIFIQSAATSGGTLFGDGLLCASGAILRLGAKTTVAGSATFPGPGDPPLVNVGGVSANGGTRYYQVLYRNSVAFCTSATFNMTNGVRLVWAR
jgi:hypothetical protein